uniref:uncharacterized protein LOC122607090 n=1 Tax=Erigeron canadensis TaxID=72917 RepID=UPI001CB92F6C|nr:uncharacterized protein LOC122607090 [Erigeron canadensis]
MAILLPSIFMLQLSGGKYLSLTKNNSSEGLLKFDEEDIRSPRARFAAEPAGETGRKLFHIRSVFNNKYLVVKQINNSSSSWIVASAKTKEEDVTKGTLCTLFEPELDDATTTTGVRLRHVGTGISATAYYSSPTTDEEGVLQLLLSGDDDVGSLSSFILLDTSELMLPSPIVFRSQLLDGKYLNNIRQNNVTYHQFQSGLYLGSGGLGKRLTPRGGGRYFISDDFGFWRMTTGGWLTAVTDESSAGEYYFIHIEQDNVFALRPHPGGGLCGSSTEGQLVDCLRVRSMMTPETNLIVEEIVVKREIKDVVYRLSDARITDETIQEMDYEYGTNESQDHDDTMTFKFSATESTTRSWSSSVSVNVGVKVEFEVNFVPFVTGTKVELSMEAGYAYEWGGSVTRETTREGSYTATIPANKTVKVTMLVAKGICEVPFNYTQRDLTPYGQWIETLKEDGLFRGSTSYDIHYLKEEATPPATHRTK